MTIEMNEDSKLVLSTGIRRDVADIWGEDIENYLKACQAHMVDAVSTEATLHQRYDCMNCLLPRLFEDFFFWLNAEGYTYVIDDFDFTVFLSHAVRWSQSWTKEQLLSPCTDGMPSHGIH